MTISKTNSIKKWLLDGLGPLLAVAAFFAVFLLLCAIGWQVLQWLVKLREFIFIPYLPSTYVHLSGVGTGFPHSILSLFSVIYSDVPNSFLVVAWLFALTAQIIMLYFDWQDLPVKSHQGRTRKQLMQEMLLRKTKFLAAYTTTLFVLCIPGLRTYDVVTQENICTRGYFSLSETCYSISQLKEIERYYFGRANGLIGWKFTFTDGTLLDIESPNQAALLKLLALPKVTSNVVVSDGKLYLKLSH